MNNESRLKKSKRNMVTGVIYRVVTLLLPFVTRTAIIYSLGALYLGLNSLYSSILNVLSLAEMGFGTAMVYSMYKPMAENDIILVNALLKLYRKVYRLIGTLFLIVGGLLAPFLNYFIKGDVPTDINIYILYLVFLGNTSLSYFLYAYKSSILSAAQRSDIINNVSSIISILLNVLQVVVLWLTKSYYAYCILIPLFTIIQNLVINYEVNKRFPEYKCEGILDKETLVDIRKRVGGLFIYKLCYVLRDSIDGVVVSVFLGLTILAKYNNYFALFSAITGFIAIIKTSIVASVGNSMVTESVRKNYRDFNKCQLLYMWISGWCTVCLFCLLQPFIKLWIGEEYLFNTTVLVIFCIYFFCYKLGDICAVYRQAAGIWWQDRYRPIVEAVLNLVLSIILVQRLGVSGVLIATIFCLVFINFIWASRVLFKEYFKTQSQSLYLARLGLYSLATVIACAVTYFICSLFHCEGLTQLMINFAICLIIPNLIFFAICMNLPEFKDTIELVKILIKR